VPGLPALLLLNLRRRRRRVYVQGPGRVYRRVAVQVDAFEKAMAFETSFSLFRFGFKG
jgi:hypothetical protein